VETTGEWILALFKEGGWGVATVFLLGLIALWRHYEQRYDRREQEHRKELVDRDTFWTAELERRDELHHSEEERLKSVLASVNDKVWGMLLKAQEVSERRR